MLAQGGGRYCIEDDEFPQLHRLMAAAAEDDFYVTLTYTLTQRCHYFCDLDFLVRAHTEAHARSLVNIEQACRLVARALRGAARALHLRSAAAAGEERSGTPTRVRRSSYVVGDKPRRRSPSYLGLPARRQVELSVARGAALSALRKPE